MDRKEYIKTLLGNLEFTQKDGALTSLRFSPEIPGNYKMSGDVHDFAVKITNEINEYAMGKRKEFDIPVSFFSTPFIESVWKELIKIPYGKTLTYGEVAKKISNPKGARAVGMACNKNPIAIIVPCHRVVGKNSLTGYEYGLEIKKILLDIEKANDK